MRRGSQIPSKIEFGEVRVETLPTQIARRIRESILDGRLTVNERLPREGELAERFGVSRPTVREALKRLAAQKLVRSRRGVAGGNFVNTPSLMEAREDLAVVTTLLVGMGEFSLAQITETRLSLECLCAELAAIHRSDEHLGRMGEEIALQRNEALTDEEFCASDVRFHGTMADASGNAMLRFIMASVIEALQPVSNLVVFRQRERGVIVDQHSRILQCLEQRNSAGAKDILREQSEYLQARFAEAQAVISERQARLS